MKIHIKIYHEHFDISPGETILCEVDCKVAVDVHHIEPKGMGGRKGDEAIRINRIENLIALCRKCHDEAHASILTKSYLILVHRYKLSGKSFFADRN